jgi:hypothetical protein
MISPARIAAVVAGLAVVLAGSYAVGNAVGPLDRGSSAQAGHGGDDHAEPAAAAPAADGLAVAADGLRLVPDSRTLPPGRTTEFSFRIEDDHGHPVETFDVVHEKRMHLIVASRDLSSFHHVHPVADHHGTWSINLAALRPGAYRGFADFSTEGRATTLGADITVPGVSAPRPFPPFRANVDTGGYDVNLATGSVIAGREVPLTFEVTRGGAPVAVDPYLGARGHLVILREGDLAYLHTHAEADVPSFRATFPSAGRYRAFLQVSVGGVVRTAAFTLEAGE